MLFNTLLSANICQRKYFELELSVVERKTTKHVDQRTE